MPSFEHIKNCLSLVDSFLLGQWQTDVSLNGRLEPRDALYPSRNDGLAEELIFACVAAEILAQDSQDMSNLGEP